MNVTRVRKAMLRSLAIAAMAIGATSCSSVDSEGGGDNGGSRKDVETEEISLGYSVDMMLAGSMSGGTRAGEEGEGGTTGGEEGSGSGSGSGGEGTGGGEEGTGTEPPIEYDEHGHPSYKAEEHETQIKHVYFLFFKKGSFVDFQRAEVREGERQVRFPVPSTLQTETDYQVIMVANAGNYKPEGSNTFDSFLQNNTQGRTLDQVRQILAVGVDHTMNHNTDQYLPMEGKLVDENGNEIPFNFDVINGRYVANGQIKFKRLVSRIDLNNYDPGSLNIKWVKVCNYRTSAYVCHAAMGGTVDPGISDETPQAQYDSRQNYTPVEEAKKETLESGGELEYQTVQHSLYCFPNTVSTPKQEDAVTTYIMIAGYYGTDEELSYYRFNLNRGTDAQNLEKNHIYTANIMGVKGRGAKSESAARLTDAPMLVATVDELWEDDDKNTDADASGNFLILSRTLVSFDGREDQKESVSVKVRPGMTWDFEMVPTTGASNNDFIVNKEGDELVITARYLNNTNFVKYGYIKVTGVTSDKTTSLSVNITLQQLSINDDEEKLTVNGQTGTLEPKLSGLGSTLLYQVQTGSGVVGWNVQPVESNGWNAWGASGASYTHTGGNKGYLEIKIPANITGKEREVTLKVSRDAGDVDPVYIVLKQPKSKVLLSVYPYPQNGILELEGFLDEKRQGPKLYTGADRTNSFSVRKDIFVNLSDPVDYYFKVESNFDADRDLAISKHNPLPFSIQAEHKSTSTRYQELTELENGEKFYMNVFRTGPGDRDIKGTIKITAYPKDPASGLPEQSISFDVNITTNCEINDCVIYHTGTFGSGTPFLIADRNVGALPRLDGHSYKEALNYSTVPYMSITNSGKRTDNDNKLFSGTYYKWYDIYTHGYDLWVEEEYFEPNYDPNEYTSRYYTDAYRKSWHMANNDMYTYIGLYMQWSKGRPYIVSDLKHKGRYVGCYFPLAGNTSNQSALEEGQYLSQTPYDYVTNCYIKRYLKDDNFTKLYYISYNDGEGDASKVEVGHTVRCYLELNANEVYYYGQWLDTH